MSPDEAREIAIAALRNLDIVPEIYAEAAAVLEAQGRIEEKKAAFLEAAMELGARLTTDWVQSGDVRATVAFMAAYRLVEAEKAGESASKKEPK